MLRITRSVSILETEIETTAIRAQGPGGQNVNKVSSAVQLRFDISASSLPESYKERLLRMKDHRITQDGMIVIKAQRYRSQQSNRDDAVRRLCDLIRRAGVVKKKRVPTKPSKAANQRRLENKTKRGRQKALRRKVDSSDY